MAEYESGSDAELDRRLRSALQAAAPPADPAGVVSGIHRRVKRRQRNGRMAIAAVVAVVLGGGAAAGVTWASNPRPTPRSAISPNATPPTTVPTENPGKPPPAPLPCPANDITPSMATGSFCGPRPPAGSGLGPGGECTGKETIPPCGPGAVPNRYYAYTMPGTCSGLIIFDGRQWVAELTPPTRVPGADVWMQITAGGAVGWISPTGSVGFQPYTGQPLATCRS